MLAAGVKGSRQLSEWLKGAQGLGTSKDSNRKALGPLANFCQLFYFESVEFVLLVCKILP